MKENWWETVTDVTDEDVLNLVLMYNSFITLHCKQENERVKYYIKYKSKNFRKHRHYGDAIRLYRFLKYNDYKPREYFTVQFIYYKKEAKHPYSRPVPSMKNLITPAALGRWTDFLIKKGRQQPPSVTLSDAEKYSYEETYLSNLMKSWGFSSEKELFRDIVLARHFGLDFLKKRPTFMELISESYYETTYHVKEYAELFEDCV